MNGKPADNAGVVAPPPAIMAAPLVAGWLADRAVRVPLPLPSGMRKPLGLASVGAGAGLDAWFLWTMRAADTPFDPRKPVRHLVTGGPFALSRNPSYVSMALVVAGIALLRGSLWTLLLLGPALALLERGVVAREERYLERKFGDEYVEYQRRVRRWV